jgi:hypothetical protein
MESNENYYDYYDNNDDDGSQDQQQNQSYPGDQVYQNEQYDQAQQDLDGRGSKFYWGFNTVDQYQEAGAIPNMNENNEPTDPYENQNKQQTKKNRMKQLKKNRFQAELDPAVSMNSGMQNMNISGARRSNIASANVPQDMHIANEEPTYQDNSPSRDYTKLDTLNNMDKGSLAKPK